MRIALTGASGFLGSNIARHVHEEGHSVTALVRGTSTRAHIEAYVDRFVVGNHADRDAWPALLDGADAIVHNSLDVQSYRDRDWGTHLTSNLVGSIGLLLASAPLPFVFISTCAVHHDTLDRWEGVVDEEHPTRPFNLYGAYKAAVETHLWAAHHEHGRHAVAIRPSAVYGPDPTRKNLHTRPTFDAIKAGETYTRNGSNPFVHVEDVCRATLRAIERPEAAGQAYNLVDMTARYTELAQHAGEALGVEPVIDVPDPDPVPHRFDNAKARGLVPQHPDFLARGRGGLREHFRLLSAGGDG